MKERDTIWGLPHQQWAALRERMRTVLTGVAATQGTITYGELAAIVFDGRFSARSGALQQMLYEVCELEDAAHAAACSTIGSVVVRADSGIPGKGYFADRPGTATPDAARQTWQQDINRTWQEYANMPSQT